MTKAMWDFLDLLFVAALSCRALDAGFVGPDRSHSPRVEPVIQRAIVDMVGLVLRHFMHGWQALRIKGTA